MERCASWKGEEMEKLRSLEGRGDMWNMFLKEFHNNRGYRVQLVLLF